MNLYDRYFKDTCKDIPICDLDLLVQKFIIEASIDMGHDFKDDDNKKTVLNKRTLDIIRNDFKHLPLYCVAGAFKKGALGKYGQGRLVPRTIYGWLSEMSLSYSLQRCNEHEQIDETYKWNGLHRYPIGKAINKKIDWLSSGAITLEDWDKISLKELADIINIGTTCSPELFGITNRSRNINH
jgi:hypothetical protein